MKEHQLNKSEKGRKGHPSRGQVIHEYSSQGNNHIFEVPDGAPVGLYFMCVSDIPLQRLAKVHDPGYLNAAGKLMQE